GKETSKEFPHVHLGFNFLPQLLSHGGHRPTLPLMRFADPGLARCAISRVGSALGLARLGFWGSPVEFLGDCTLSRFTCHFFLALLLDAVLVGQDALFSFRLRGCPVAGFFVWAGPESRRRPIAHPARRQRPSWGGRAVWEAAAQAGTGAGRRTRRSPLP